METPHPTVPTSPLPALAPVAVEGIGEITGALLEGMVEAFANEQVEPSRPTRRRPRRRNAPPEGQCPPITCAACAITYITTVTLPPAVAPDGWICGVCLGALLNGSPGESR